MIETKKFLLKQAPPGFYRFAKAVIQDLHIFETEENFYRFSLGPMSHGERQEFINFIDDFNAGAVSDENMMRFWRESYAKFPFSDPKELRRFLTDAAERARSQLRTGSAKPGPKKR